VRVVVRGGKCGCRGVLVDVKGVAQSQEVYAAACGRNRDKQNTGGW